MHEWEGVSSLVTIPRPSKDGGSYSSRGDSSLVGHGEELQALQSADSCRHPISPREGASVDPPEPGIGGLLHRRVGRPLLAVNNVLLMPAEGLRDELFSMEPGIKICNAVNLFRLVLRAH